jgi:acyl-coenzyme A synthetase/AMP-(fatty) acid ligase
LSETGGAGERHLHGRGTRVALDALARGSSLGGHLAALDDRSVLVFTGDDQLAAALTLIELDGVARRMILCPADFPREHLPAVIAKGQVDAIVCNEQTNDLRTLDVPLHVVCTPAIQPEAMAPATRRRTEWVLFTSGTTGVPKMVVHSLAGLTSAIRPGGKRDTPIVWGTFYDIRRYGGLQILLRAVIDGGSLVLSHAGEPVGEHLARLGAHGATHVSGTPSHWRRVLMNPAARAMAPGYVRLSGEIADQAVLDHLHALYPHARIVHAFASTEAGVGFEVGDGREGVPASTIAQGANGAELKVADGSLRIRSPGNATRYVGDGDLPLAGRDGFVDTNDMLERRGERYYFVGRRGRIINVGGLKVHPEEVEAVINRHPAVRLSLVRPRRNAITGAIVVADVVLKDGSAAPERSDDLRHEIVELCRHQLPRHKVPAAVQFVPALTFSASGKLARHYA